MTQLLTPNEKISRQLTTQITMAWIGLWLICWVMFRPVVLPSPFEVLEALPDLWMNNDLGQELFTSFFSNMKALALSTVLSLTLAYLSVIPSVRPMVHGISKLRFISPISFRFAFILLLASGYAVKLSVLTLGITVFFVTSMLSIVDSIPKERFDHARTLRMTEWQIVWYVIIRGTLGQAIDVLRDNAAMGWSMIMMVEGILREQGGLGVVLIDQGKHLNTANVYAVILCIIGVGLLQDYALGQMKRVVSPDSFLGMERV
jgi:NitT/TauT family transport system permease protein